MCLLWVGVLAPTRWAPPVIVRLETAALGALLEWREITEAQLPVAVSLTVLRALAMELTRPSPISREPVVLRLTVPRR